MPHRIDMIIDGGLFCLELKTVFVSQSMLQSQSRQERATLLCSVAVTRLVVRLLLEGFQRFQAL